MTTAPRFAVVAGTCALLIAGAAQAQPPSTGVVRGTVSDDEGLPVAMAEVAATTGKGLAQTDSTGTFVIRGLRPGNDAFIVRRLGFVPMSFSLVVPSDSIVSLAITLRRSVVRLPEVITTEKFSERLNAVGFAERKSGMKGFFITRSEIESRASSRASDLLHAVPRVVLKSFGGRGKIPYGGSGCVMQVVVDGFPVKLDPRPGLLLTLDDVVNPSMIEGIEVYAGATDAPLEFQSITYACGTLVIWTRKEP